MKTNNSYISTPASTS